MTAGSAPGPVALVTGGGRGLGRVLAHALADAGWQVGLVARSGAELADTATAIRAAGGVAHHTVADVHDQHAVATATADVVRALGPVELLVNNAGVTGTIGPTWEVPADDWWRTVEINLRGAELCTRAVLPAMIERRRGRIVIVTSNAGVHRWPWATAYAVSKAAAVKLAENLAAETSRHGVRAFSLDPGLLRIGLSDPAFAGSDADTGTLDGPRDVLHAWMRREVDAGRGAEPELAVALLHRIARGELDALSGRHLAVHDDVDAALARITEVRRDDLHVLRIRRSGPAVGHDATGLSGRPAPTAEQ